MPSSRSPGSSSSSCRSVAASWRRKTRSKCSSAAAAAAAPCSRVMISRARRALRSRGLTAPRLQVGRQSRELVGVMRREQAEVGHHRLVGDAHDLAVDVARVLGDADVVARCSCSCARCRLCPAGCPCVMIACGCWPKYSWRSRPMKRLNFWSVPPSSMSASDGDRVVALGQGIEHLEHADGLMCRPALGEIVALEDASHGGRRGELEDLLDGEGRQPLAVVAHLELGRVVVEDQERLLLIGLRVGVDDAPGRGEGASCCGPTGRRCAPCSRR